MARTTSWLGDAKLAGILLERAGDAVVVGFGANLAHHPDGLERAVTSIAALAGSAPSAADVAERLAGSFSHWLSRWRGEGIAPVREAWLESAHPLGTMLSTPAGEGRFAGLSPDGALKLEVDGSVRLVHAGDVFLV
jgi:BirA family biotin operon repressor/biotin-[acetyl-CoA-carboxylase] ligase